MKAVLLLVATAVAVGLHATTPAAAVAGSTAKSLVSDLLVATGYSTSCVTECLNTCSPSQLTPSPAPLSDTLMQEGIKLLQELRQILHQFVKRPQHCKDLLDGGDSGKGLRHIYPFPQQPQRNVTVYCDHTVYGGGWTVFQRRTNDTERERFERSWQEYKDGFGDMEGEFWLGLDLLHQLTSSQPQELRIDLADYEGETRYAKYDNFDVGPPEDKYRLSVAGYSGDAGDSLTVPHDEAMFSTPDAWGEGDLNCAERYRSGWWHAGGHGYCLLGANLNGFQHEGEYDDGVWSDGIVWHAWRRRGYSLRRTAMLTRPAR